LISSREPGFAGNEQQFVRAPRHSQMRVAHAIGMISGLAGLPLRPMIYFAGWIAMLIFARQVLLNAA
jgi:hypothetical protein